MIMRWRSCLFLLLLSQQGFSQGLTITEAQNSSDPLRKVGQMFTVTIRPGAKHIEVQVVGNDVASATFSNVSVLASLKVGNKEWVITPKKNREQFIVDSPIGIPVESKSELRLEIHDSNRKENFDFKINGQKP